MYNRKSGTERLSNAQVNIGNDPDGKGNLLCGQVGDTTNKSVLEFKCTPPIQGRYVKVSIPGTILTLCEVEVFSDSGDNRKSGNKS